MLRRQGLRVSRTVALMKSEAPSFSSSHLAIDARPVVARPRLPTALLLFPMLFSPTRFGGKLTGFCSPPLVWPIVGVGNWLTDFWPSITFPLEDVMLTLVLLVPLIIRLR